MDTKNSAFRKRDKTEVELSTTSLEDHTEDEEKATTERKINDSKSLEDHGDNKLKKDNQ